MRAFLTILPLALMASPVLAQTPAPAPAPVPHAADRMTIPAELSDPRTTDRLVDAMKVMSKVFLELPMGEMEAAMQGRQPTAADRARTVRSESRLTDQQLRQQIEQARPMMQGAMRALMASLPAMMKGMSEAAKQMERATANLPQPGYPKQ